MTQAEITKALLLGKVKIRVFAISNRDSNLNETNRTFDNVIDIERFWKLYLKSQKKLRIMKPILNIFYDKYLLM